jgi:hypothetical protein
LLFLMVQPFSLPTKRKGAKSLKPSWIRDVHRRYTAGLHNADATLGQVPC